MQVKPVGYRILIRPDPIEEVSKGGIVIAVGEGKKQEQAAQVFGTVLALGDLAYQESLEKGFYPWCKAGDKITYQKYAGMRIPGREDLLLLNDTDVTAVITVEG